MRLLQVLILVTLFTSPLLYGQGVGINTTGGTPNASTILDVESTDKGVLIPRVALTGTTDATTITNGNVLSLLVFNTATVSDVVPGYYYWDGTVWKTMGGNANTDNQDLTFDPTTNVLSLTNDATTIDLSSLLDTAYKYDEWKDSDSISMDNFIYANQALQNGDTVVVTDAGDLSLGASTSISNELGLTHKGIKVQNNSGSAAVLLNSYRDVANHSKLWSFANRGTSGAPLSLNNRDLLLELVANGYDGTNMQPGTRIIFRTDSVSSTDFSTAIDFQTRDLGTSVYGTKMSILGNGNVGIGTRTPSQKLEIRQANANAGFTTYRGEGSMLRLYNVDGSDGNVAFIRTSVLGDGYHFGSFLNTNDDVAFQIRKELTSDASDVVRLHISDNGNVGVGTTLPSEKLDVFGTIKANGAAATLILKDTDATLNTDVMHSRVLFRDQNEDLLGIIGFSTSLQGMSIQNRNINGGIHWSVGGTVNSMVLHPNGDLGLGIGTTLPAEKLQVNGNIRATSFISNTTTYADYVFEDYYKGESKINKEYSFLSLEEVENYIKKESHLPGVKSIKEVETKDGYVINLGETSIKNLEKIEELYLHVIEINKENKELKKTVNDLEKRLSEIENK